MAASAHWYHCYRQYSLRIGSSSRPIRHLSLFLEHRVKSSGGPATSGEESEEAREAGKPRGGFTKRPVLFDAGVESSRWQKGGWIWPVIGARVRPPPIIGDLRLFREGMPSKVLRETAKDRGNLLPDPLHRGPLPPAPYITTDINNIRG